MKTKFRSCGTPCSYARHAWEGDEMGRTIKVWEVAGESIPMVEEPPSVML